MKSLAYGLLAALAASLLTAILMWPAAPADGPVPIAWGRDSCARCRMILSQKAFGGEIRAADGAVSKFDDRDCLEAARAELAAPPRGVWLVDHATSELVPEAEAVGFHFFSAHVSVSHAYVHMVDFGAPVKVGGLWIRPGDLLHGDQHGVVVVPPEIAPRIPSSSALSWARASSPMRRVRTLARSWRRWTSTKSFARSAAALRS